MFTSTPPMTRRSYSTKHRTHTYPARRLCSSTIPAANRPTNTFYLMLLKPFLITNLSTTLNLQLGTQELGPCIRAVRLGTLDGRAQGAVDDQLGQDAESTRHAEEHGVVARLS